MKNFKNECRIKVEGVNIDRIYKTLMKNNIVMSDIDRPDYKVIYFNIKNREVKKTLKLIDYPSYKVNIEKFFGVSKIFDFLRKRFAILIVFVLFFSSLFINSKLVSNIKIYGNNNISSQEIINILNQEGVKKFALIKNINTEKCENILLSKFDQIGLISVVKLGNNIIINVKEKTDNVLINDASDNIIAKYYGQIVEIETIQGTPLVKDGDIIKPGDVLVGSYYYEGNEKVKCKANAKIKQKIWFSHSQTFLNEQVINERTGNKIINTKISLGSLIINEKNNENTFSDFEIEESENYYFKNNFIPLKINKTIYYELKQKNIKVDFDEYKNSIIKNCYDKAKEKLPTGLTVTKTFDTINVIEGGYVVSAYYECETYI